MLDSATNISRALHELLRHEHNDVSRDAKADMKCSRYTTCWLWSSGSARISSSALNLVKREPPIQVYLDSPLNNARSNGLRAQQARFVDMLVI